METSRAPQSEDRDAQLREVKERQARHSRRNAQLDALSRPKRRVLLARGTTTAGSFGPRRAVIATRLSAAAKEQLYFSLAGC